MRHAALSATLLLLAACSKDPAPAAPAKVQAPAAAAPAAAASASPKVKLECDRLLSKDLLAKHGYSGASGKVDATGTILECNLAGGKLTTALFSCPTWGADEKVMRETMENGKRAQKNAKDLSLGRMGYAFSIATIGMVQFWDDDTPCFVTLSVQDEAKGAALARDLVASLTPAAIAP
jgi:hypothetical protein